jgi:hypothetical protein
MSARRERTPDLLPRGRSWGSWEPSPAINLILAITSETVIWSVVQLGRRHRRETRPNQSSAVQTKKYKMDWYAAYSGTTENPTAAEDGKILENS